MITVTDAMNAMGQDWECAEALRDEVRRLRAVIADSVVAHAEAATIAEFADKVAAALDASIGYQATRTEVPDLDLVTEDYKLGVLAGLRAAITVTLTAKARRIAAGQGASIDAQRQIVVQA